MKKKLQIAVGLIVGIGLVWLLFRNTNWANVLEAIQGADRVWLAVSTLAVFVSFFTRSQRWGYIVRTEKPVPFRTLFNATQIGFFGNYTLPARAGELIRAFVLSRRERIPFTKCVAFAALDRVTDLFGLLAVLLITMWFFHPDHEVVLPDGMVIPKWAHGLLQPGAIVTATEYTVVGITGVMGALIALYLNQPLVLRICGAVVGLVSKKLADRANEMLSHFAEGLHIFRSARDMVLAIFWSLVTWSMAATCFWALIVAFHLDAPWYAACLVLAMLSIAISLPGAPGFIGQYHAGIMIPLIIMVPGISEDTAKAVAILGHLINLAAVAVVGVYSLHSENVGLISLQQESLEVAEHAKEKQAG